MLSQSEISDLMTRSERLCWWIARRVAPGKSNEIIEDLAAEARLLILQAAQTFAPDGAASFATYVQRFTRARVRGKWLLELRRGIHLPQGLEHVRSVDVKPPGRLSGRDWSEPMAPISDEAAEFPIDFWDRIRSAVTAAQWRCLSLYYRDGLTQAAVADRLGMSRTNVNQLINRAYEEIRRRCPELAKRW